MWITSLVNSNSQDFFLSRSRPRLWVLRPRLYSLSSRRLETKTIVSRTTSLLIYIISMWHRNNLVHTFYAPYLYILQTDTAEEHCLVKFHMTPHKKLKIQVVREMRELGQNGYWTCTEPARIDLHTSCTTVPAFLHLMTLRFQSHAIIV